MGVVHGAVDIVAREVFPLLAVADLIRRVFPDFTDEDGVGIFFFQGLIELPQERNGQLVDDIEAPTADALIEPVFEDAFFLVNDEIHVRRRRFFDVGQIRHAPPRFVFIRIVGESEPFVVRRFLRLVSTDTGIMAEAVEVDAVGPGMAENAVEDDGHAGLFGRFTEGGKFFIGPQHGIDAEIIGRAVAVIARTFKDGIEVNGRNAQFF